ncbi:PIN domain-containing protein [Sphingomonas endolithica]|uniref:PIN domain-containing protein n=1 Tax=Sphingomonas endolithica TaxID=2972485 RepID=UPI0021B00F3F|nr:PIN domain-containing protein [Sphingomonas sp. ZFBP2030]
MPGSFFDSNVPLSVAVGDDAKANLAEQLLSSGGIVSVQVLNEVANVALRKYGFTIPEVVTFIDSLRFVVKVVPVTVETHEVALIVRERHRFAFHDCAIVAAALLADCETLWSEDMHDGLVVDGRLTIRNPFAGAA